MKKILLIISILVLIVTGCGNKKENIDNSKNEYNTRRSNYVAGLGTTSDKKMVVKYYNGNEEECYYVFFINGNSYSQKQVTLHNNKESFHNLVNKHSKNTYSELIRNSELDITEIYLRKNQAVKDKDVLEYLKSKYSDTSKYTIIYEKED